MRKLLLLNFFRAFRPFFCIGNINNINMYQESVNYAHSECKNSAPEQKLSSQYFATTKLNPTNEVEQLNLMDTSFQNDLSKEHSEAIWNASIQFLRNSLKIKFDEKKGFNDQNIIESHMEIKDSISEQTEISQIISKNEQLNFEQKNGFVSALKQSRHLKQLLIKLNQMFCQEVFQQLVILLFQAWEQYEIYKETTRLSEELSKFMFPSFTNFDSNQLKNTKPSDVYIKEKQSEIIEKADDAACGIARDYFISTKLHYLNLKQVDVSLNNSNILRREFERFVKAITQGLFLCADGCFNNFSKSTWANDSNDQVWFSQKSLDQGQLPNKNGRKRRNN